MQELLDKIAQETYGEFGFATCTDEQQMEILYETVPWLVKYFKD